MSIKLFIKQKQNAKIVLKEVSFVIFVRSIMKRILPKETLNVNSVRWEFVMNIVELNTKKYVKILLFVRLVSLDIMENIIAKYNKSLIKNILHLETC